jgi:NTP pyrophosphatase (non-canonical NTP hydrolase)
VTRARAAQQHKPFQQEKLARYALDEWIAEFDAIYHDVNMSRAPLDIWLHVVERASAIHEHLRTADFSAMLDDLPWVYCWVCAFVFRASRPGQMKIRPSLAAIILDKYPRRCFYCQQTKCTCQSSFGSRLQTDLLDKQARLLERRQYAEAEHSNLESLGTSPKSLPDFLEMFNSIYGHKNYDLPIESIAAHFQEEIGEVCKCINDANDSYLLGRANPVTTRDLEEEIADVFTWLSALYWKVDYILGGAQEYLSGQPRRRNHSQLDLPSLGRGLHELTWRFYAKKKRGGTYMADPKTGERPLMLAISADSRTT